MSVLHSWFKMNACSKIYVLLNNMNHSPFERLLLYLKGCLHWAIPENIRTIPRTASRNSECKGGLFELEFRRHGGILASGILKAWGG